MTKRERLIELLNNGFYEALSKIKGEDKDKKACDFLADFLLSNGVIVPPAKVGERRIDDLGRIQIPKDIRKSLGINYGDVMSINVSDASIILRKEREQK